MSWNYRLMLHVEEEEKYLAFHEVYYNGIKIVGWTKNPVSIIRDNIAGIKKAFSCAVKQPILNYETGKEINDQAKYK